MEAYIVISLKLIKLFPTFYKLQQPLANILNKVIWIYL